MEARKLDGKKDQKEDIKTRKKEDGTKGRQECRSEGQILLRLQYQKKRSKAMTYPLHRVSIMSLYSLAKGLQLEPTVERWTNTGKQMDTNLCQKTHTTRQKHEQTDPRKACISHFGLTLPPQHITVGSRATYKQAKRKKERKQKRTCWHSRRRQTTQIGQSQTSRSVHAHT